MHNGLTMLLSNAALIAVFVAIWAAVEDAARRRLGDVTSIVLGLLAGVFSIALTRLPIEWRPGIFLDINTVPIALSAFFAGPFGAIVSAFVAALYRIYHGGVGVSAGVLMAVLAAGTGAIAHSVVRWREADVGRLGALSLANALCPQLSFFMLPAAMWPVILSEMAAPLTVLVFLGTLAAASLLRQEIKRREASRNNEIFRAVIDALPDCLNVKDREGRFIAANPATARLMHVPNTDALVGRSDADFYPAEIAARLRADEDAVYGHGQPTTVDQQLVRADGSSFWLSTMKVPFRDASGAVIGMITHNREITSQKRTELELLESQNRLQDALSNMADGLVMFDRNDRLLFCNEQYRRMFPKTADVRIPGARFSDILEISRARGEQLEQPAGSRPRLPGPVTLSPGTREIGLWDGRWLEARTRHVREGSLIVFSDITQTKRVEELLRELNGKLSEAARTDALTGLANRRWFDETLRTEFGRARRNSVDLSLVLVDLDRFKQFNDRYGHPAGDECLKQVSACLQSFCKRSTDIAARYGGEELVAILPDTSEEGALQFAESFRAAVKALEIPHEASDCGFATVSIGVATCVPARGSRLDDLIQSADKALYRAKQGGRDRVEVAEQPEEEIAAVV